MFGRILNMPQGLIDIYDALWDFSIGILLEVQKCIYLMLIDKDCDKDNR